MAGIKKYRGETHTYTYRLDQVKFEKMRRLSVLHDRPISFEFDDAVDRYLEGHHEPEVALAEVQEKSEAS
jgi:hypothetical protein